MTYDKGSVIYYDNIRLTLPGKVVSEYPLTSAEVERTLVRPSDLTGPLSSACLEIGARVAAESISNAHGFSETELLSLCLLNIRQGMRLTSPPPVCAYDLQTLDAPLQFLKKPVRAFLAGFRSRLAEQGVSWSEQVFARPTTPSLQMQTDTVVCRSMFLDSENSFPGLCITFVQDEFDGRDCSFITFWFYSDKLFKKSERKALRRLRL